MNETFLIEAIEKQEIMGLLYGKIGIAIYSFCNANNNSSLLNTSLGQELTALTCEKINDRMDFSLSYGLAGIGIGLDYLIKQSYVEGNVDEVLEEIDNLLFKKAAYISNNDEKVEMLSLIEVLFYLSFRFENGLKNKVNRAIFEDLVIKLINYIYINRTEDLYNEPIPFSLYNPLALFLRVLARFHKLGIYTFRIEKILAEMKFYIFSRIPVLHGNKLMLLYAVRAIYNTTHKKGWKEYSELIENRLSIHTILSDEMKDKNIFFTDGLAGICVLLELYNKENSDTINVEYESFYNRIANSLIWKEFESDPEFLKKRIGLDGYLGLQQLLTHLKSKIQPS